MYSLKLTELNINTENWDIPSQYNVCDIVLGGGGFRSYYHLGLFKIIKDLKSNKKIRPRYLIGTSSGAISAVYHVCGIDDQTILSTYDLIKTCMDQGLSLHDAAINTLKQVLPPNAHLICNGKVRIFVSVLGWTGFYPKYIDRFDSFDDLINSISASINIPWFTSNSCTGTIINGSRCYDGIFTSIVPSLSFHDVPQLEISTHRVLYPKRHTLHPGDSHIYLLGIRGLIETKNFFTSHFTPNNGIIRWIESKTKKTKTTKVNKFILFIIPGLMLFCSQFITGKKLT